jgi:trk system potassium uptake protein TrkA
MYIIIVGAGEVGSYLGRILVEEGHSVALIERDERLARELDGELDALVVHGSGIEPTPVNATIARNASDFLMTLLLKLTVPPVAAP